MANHVYDDPYMFKIKHFKDQHHFMNDLEDQRHA